MKQLATHSAGSMSLTAELDLSTRTPKTSAAEALDASRRASYRKHFPMVLRTLRRLGVPPSELEDALQDVFVVLFRRWSDFEGRSEFETWIYGIVLRVAKDYRRATRRHARRVEALHEALGVEPPKVEKPDALAERREALRLIQAALARLSDEHRELIVLVELEQLPVRVAADAARLGLRTCQRRLRAAHAALESALADLLEPQRRSQ